MKLHEVIRSEDDVAYIIQQMVEYIKKLEEENEGLKEQLENIDECIYCCNCSDDSW